MSVEVKVPEVGESIHEVQISRWLKQEGDHVKMDEDIVELESEKATVQVPAPQAGVLGKILKQDGEFAEVGEVLTHIEEGGEGNGADKSSDSAKQQESSDDQRQEATATQQREKEDSGEPSVMPAAQRVLSEYGLDANKVQASGPGGRLLKEDVLRYIQQNEMDQKQQGGGSVAEDGDRQEEVVPMSMIRRTIASRLVEAQQTAALLTTFNEIDMTAVMELRSRYKQEFQDSHEVKLGFMSFFVKASIEALKRYPQVNAEIREKNIVYRNYFDVGIAIGGGKGLVVPVLRNAERLSFAQIEQAIGEYARRAQGGQLNPKELEGGTFTITNGGIYGSLLSTPIISPPQSGVLGLHAIQERPIALNGQVVIRPMMYIALTYDHRIVDGREAVTFLKTIKERIEDPARILLEV